MSEEINGGGVLRYFSHGRFPLGGERVDRFLGGESQIVFEGGGLFFYLQGDIVLKYPSKFDSASQVKIATAAKKGVGARHVYSPSGGNCRI